MIGVIFTGGTIGSKVNSEGYISADKSDDKFLLLEKYYMKYDKDRRLQFVTSVPYTILSENLNTDHVLKLALAVKEMIEENSLQGIIITHGTDSLQFTAAYLWHILGKFLGEKNIPVVLVSSAYVLSDQRENGSINFKGAVDLIEYFASDKDSAGKTPDGNGTGNVFVSYQNTDGSTYIHYGNKLLAHSAFDADVHSIFDEYYAKDVNGKIILNSGAVINNILEQDINVSSKNITGKIADDKWYRGKFSKVMFLKMYPGEVYPEIACDVKAVLIESYHSGTICVGDELAEFCIKCSKNNVKVYLTGITSKAAQYETVQVYERLNVIPLYDEAPISAYCRLTLECD